MSNEKDYTRWVNKPLVPSRALCTSKFKVKNYLFCETETAGCDLEKKETTALEVFWGDIDTVKIECEKKQKILGFIQLIAIILIIAFWDSLISKHSQEQRFPTKKILDIFDSVLCNNFKCKPNPLQNNFCINVNGTFSMYFRHTGQDQGCPWVFVCGKTYLFLGWLCAWMRPLRKRNLDMM